jgi:hypothetical protein
LGTDRFFAWFVCAMLICLHMLMLLLPPHLLQGGYIVIISSPPLPT